MCLSYWTDVIWHIKCAEARMGASEVLNMSIAESGIIPAPEPVSSESQLSRISIPEHVDTWDEYFLYMAVVASIKSKDPKCPVGAIIVSADHVVLSTGFNGLPRGVHDDEDMLLDADEKLRVICHAESNAILNSSRIGVPLQGASIYVTKFPCLACCNTIIQAGIKRIYTHDDAFWNDDPSDGDHSRKKRALHQARIQVEAPFHQAFRPAEQIIVAKKKRPLGTPVAVTFTPASR
jgi:dCMP deaminase